MPGESGVNIGVHNPRVPGRGHRPVNGTVPSSIPWFFCWK
jgi:hypothetical protein